MARPSAWPAADTATDIYHRLCDGDPVASSDLAVAYLDPLAEWVARTNRGVDPHLCDQAAEEAILSLIRNPGSYKPDRSPLDTYLRLSATGDLRNLLEREGRHSTRRAPLDAVDLVDAGRNIDQEDDPAEIVGRAEDERARERQWTAIVDPDAFTPQETRVLELLRQGERSTSAYAAVLGIAHLPPGEQRQEVKRVKDRVKRRLQRARGGP